MDFSLSKPSGIRAFFLFFLLPLFFYAFPSLFRDIYGMEARNALFAKEMLEHGISFIPTLMGRPYADYPPLYFFLEYLFSIPTGRVTTFTAVLPSAISASMLVFLTWHHIKESSTFLASASAVVLASAPGFYLKATHATVDMLLALTTFSAFLLLLQKFYLSNDKKIERGLLIDTGIFFLLGLSFLAKGPVGLVIPLGSTFVFLVMEKKWKMLGYFAIYSAVISALLSISYFFMVYLQGGAELLSEVWQNQVATRVETSVNKPFYYYPLYIISSFSTWFAGVAALWFFLKMKSRCSSSPFDNKSDKLTHEEDVSGKISKKRCDLLLSQCVAGLFFIFAMFSLASSRHGRYLLPAFPFIATLTAASASTITCRFNKISLYAFTQKFLIILGTSTLALLSAYSIFIEPIIASKESGRTFMKEVSEKATPATPITIFGINPDGDGLKLAFYTKEHKKLKFVYKQKGKMNFKPHEVVILYEKDAGKIVKKFNVRHIASGLVHSKEIAAFELLPR